MQRADFESHNDRSSARTPESIAVSDGHPLTSDGPKRDPRFIDGPVRFVFPMALGAFVVVSQVRTGVDIEDILRFGLYWCLALLLPGLIVGRLLLGRQSSAVEDLSIAAVTGLALETMSWIAGVSLGLGSLVRFWWLAVVVLGCVITPFRHRWFVRSQRRVPGIQSAALCGLVALILTRFDVASYRAAPLPPNGGTLFTDLWWQLSLVQELMKFERPQVPQLAGEPLNYHFFAHIHLGMGSRISGVLPEVVLLRLWLVPIVLVSVGLATTLGRLLTSSLSAGVTTAWLAFGLPVRTYIWVGLSGFAPNPILFHSPTQVLANVCALAAAIGFISMLRRGVSNRSACWLVLIVIFCAGSKSTVIPILFAATIATLVWALVRRSASVRPLIVAAIGLIVVQAAAIALASGTSGGKITVLGTLRGLPAFEGLVPEQTLRGVNEGLLLDSIDSPRNLVYAGLALIVVMGMHTSRLAGIWVLTRRSGRADLANWWLVGAVVAGFSATMLIDHVGVSQMFFTHTIIPIGAALTVSAMWRLTSNQFMPRRTLLQRGFLLGIGLTLVLEYAVRSRQSVGGYGALDRILFPMLIVVVIVAITMIWRRKQRQWAGAITGVVLAMTIGILVPGEVRAATRTAYRWFEPVEYPSKTSSVDYVTSGELEAMSWLRDNSDATDVTVTNIHCRPLKRVEFCDARGFLVSGLAGRRSVIEGWAYTAETQRLQGEGGRGYARQPSPFVERTILSDAVTESGDLAALGEVHDRFGVRWIVIARRAGSVPAFPQSAVRERFDNGEVTILEVVVEAGRAGR